MKVLSKLRKSTEHSLLTIYKEDRQILGIEKGDILSISIEGFQLVRPVLEDYVISIPKRLSLKNIIGKNYIVEIESVFKRKEGLVRPTYCFENNKVNIRYFIPKITYSNKPLYIFPNDKTSSIIWYPVGGGAEPIILQNLIDVEKLGELLGFYFGDGSTSKGLQSFRITNSEPSTLLHCLHILEEEFGISRQRFKGQIIYSTNTELTIEIKKRCIEYWSKKLLITSDKFVSVNKSKALSESSPYGSVRLFLDNNCFVEVILRGLLPGILTRIQKPHSKLDFILLNGFLRGLFAAEGSVYLNGARLSKISLSFDPHSKESTLYRILLSHLYIQTSADKDNELYIYRRSQFKKLEEMDAFRFHTPRRNKFITGLNNYKTTSRGK